MLYEHSWPHAHRDRTRQHSKAARDRIRKRRDILPPTRLFPNIAYFSRPTPPLVFVMVPFFIIKDVDMRSGVSCEPRSVQTFVWLSEE